MDNGQPGWCTLVVVLQMNPMPIECKSIPAISVQPKLPNLPPPHSLDVMALFASGLPRCYSHALRWRSQILPMDPRQIHRTPTFPFGDAQSR